MNFFQLKFDNNAWVYLIILFLLGVVFYPFMPFVGLALFIILIFTAYFFRDPDKMVPTNENLILSPADGIITFIGKSKPPKEIMLNKENYIKISVFLSIFDIHVNRVPATGKIISCTYIKGKFINASLDKSSDDNERNIILMETKSKNKIIFVQIAGLIARRIISNLKSDQLVEQGDRFGIIQFGSRVDIYIPDKFNIQVAEGQRMIGGQTIISSLNNGFKIEKTVKK